MELLAPTAEEKPREGALPRWSEVVQPEKIIIAPRIKMLISRLVFIVWDQPPEWPDKLLERQVPVSGSALTGLVQTVFTSRMLAPDAPGGDRV
jgi:hypothetical protein